MDPSDMKDELDSLLEASSTWATEDVLTDVYFLNESGEEVKETTDICAHIGCNSNDPKQKKAHQNKFQSRLKKPETMDRLYLGPEFNSSNAEGRKLVKEFIENKFDACGGGIIATGSGGTNSLQIVFRCFRHRVSKPVHGKKSDTSRNTITSRPVSNDDDCLWRCTLYIDPRPTDADSFACRYFFYKDGGGNRFHNGHLKKKIHEITKRTELVDEDELEITVDGQEGNLGSQTMAMLSRQVWRLSQRIYERTTGQRLSIRNVVSKTLGQLPRMSPAEKVISSLSSRQDVSLVYLVAKVQLGEQLVTTCTKKKKKKKQSKPERKLNITFESNIVSNGGDIITRPATKPSRVGV